MTTWNLYFLDQLGPKELSLKSDKSTGEEDANSKKVCDCSLHSSQRDTSPTPWAHPQLPCLPPPAYPRGRQVLQTCCLRTPLTPSIQLPFPGLW